jgi:DNA invertase Pin-like site-specific DNA recombinase
MNAKATPALASPGRAALYLRVSTGRQAEHDLSIPDQRRQLQAYCQAKGIAIVAEFVEPGASATDDRRPEFQRMMDAGAQKPAPFNFIIVHSFSRFSSSSNSTSGGWRRMNRPGFAGGCLV